MREGADDHDAAVAEDTQWYFAFGANMSTAVLAKRRGLSPRRAERALVPGWRRAFVERGVPFIEPVFAGLVEAPDDQCWGVAYELSAADAARLDGFEGSGYVRVQVDAELGSGERVRSFAYASKNQMQGRKPSRRYMGLLVDGAREHGLPKHVIETLEAEPSVHIPLLSSLVPAVAVLMEAVRRRL